jgi:hypothetical protein
MRVLLAAVLAACVVGCDVKTESSFENTFTTPDGSKLTTKTQKITRNGVTTETKTETTVAPDGKTTTVIYDKKGNDWVKQGS